MARACVTNAAQPQHARLPPAPHPPRMPPPPVPPPPAPPSPLAPLAAVVVKAACSVAQAVEAR